MLISIIAASMMCMGLHFAIVEFIWTFKDSEEEFNTIMADSHWINKPLWRWPTCMASMWGTIFHFTSRWLLTGTVTADDVTWWPFAILIIAYLNTQFKKWAA